MIKEFLVEKILVKKFIFGSIFVILTTLIFGIAAFFFTRDVTIKYVSSVKILVDLNKSVSNPTTSTSFGKIQQLIPTYAQVVTSEAIAKKISEDYPEIDPREAQQSLSAGIIEKTIIMYVKVKSDSYEKADRISAAATKHFIENVKAEEAKYAIDSADRLDFKIIDKAITIESVGGRRARTMLIVTFSAFFVSAGGLIVFSSSRIF